MPEGWGNRLGPDLGVTQWAASLPSRSESQGGKTREWLIEVKQHSAIVPENYVAFSSSAPPLGPSVLDPTGVATSTSELSGPAAVAASAFARCVDQGSNR